MNQLKLKMLLLPLLLAACSSPEPGVEADLNLLYASADTLKGQYVELPLPPVVEIDYVPGDGPLPWLDTTQVLLVNIRTQKLELQENGVVLKSYSISSATAGTGSAYGSQKTPLGRHRIARKIGRGKPLGAIFKHTQYTGQVARIFSDTTNVPEDLVTTRILWLEGMEPGKNRGGRVDSFWRSIYIHGTPEEGQIGRPASHGCIRMRNADVAALFELVRLGALVVIEE